MFSIKCMAHPKDWWTEYPRWNYETSKEEDIGMYFVEYAEKFFDAKDAISLRFLCGKVFSPYSSEIFKTLERKQLQDFFARRQDILIAVISVLEKIVQEVEQDIERWLYSKVLEQAWNSPEKNQTIIIAQKQSNIITKQIITRLKKYLVSK